MAAKALTRSRKSLSTGSQMPTPQMLMLQMPQMQPVLMQSTQSIESVLMPLQKQMRPVLMCSNLMLLVLVWLMRMVDWCGL